MELKNEMTIVNTKRSKNKKLDKKDEKMTHTSSNKTLIQQTKSSEPQSLSTS